MLRRIRSGSSRALYRAFTATYRQLVRVERVLAELPLVLHDPELEQYANAEHYRQTTRYREPANQRSGLFPFEERMLARFFPPPPARLLVPGAGAGREMLALRARGYDVDGFDPVPSMVEAARSALSDHSNRGDVWVDTVEHWAERLGNAHDRFDGIFTGWVMWTHLLAHQTRLTVLRAFRRVCPNGPVLLSFWPNDRVLDPEERSQRDPPQEPLHPAAATRAEKLTREWLRRRVLHLPPIERGSAWVNGMFVHRVSEAELAEESTLAGWELAYYERSAMRFPNAVLVPRPAPAGQR